MRGCSSFRLVLRVLAPVLLCSVPLPATAQQGAAMTLPRFGIGYVGNAPDLLAGGGAYAILPVLGGIGLYVDAKFDTSPGSAEDGFIAGLTAREVDDEIGDDFRDDDSSWRSFNAAIVRPLTPSFMLYGGLGHARETVYRQYYDDTGERGLAGYYWVESPEDERSQLNVLLGMFLRMTPRLNAQFGFETMPRGGTVGLSLLLP